MRFVKPLDEVLLHEVFGRFKDVITIEDGCVQGGMGSAVTEWAMEQGYASRVARLGVPDRYIEHGTQAQLYKECGYDASPSSKRRWRCAKPGPPWPPMRACELPDAGLSQAPVVM